MTLEEQLIIDRAVLDLDRKPRNTPTAIWETLQQLNIKAMMNAQGADMARVTRKMVRSLRWAAYDQICPLVKGSQGSTIRDIDQNLQIRVMSTLFMGVDDPLQIIWTTVTLFIEQRLHRKHLPLRRGLSKAACKDTECRIGCQKTTK